MFMDNSMTDRNAKEDKQKRQLPKNIRQIGNVQGPVRVYMEDYVYTYLHGNGRSGWAHRGSIFVGTRWHENGQKYLFISGLVHIPDEYFKDGMPEFTDMMWGGVYRDMKQYYDQVEILGWGMDVAGDCAKLTGNLEQVHRKAFQGQEKFAFLMDSLEKEEAFYIYEKNMLRRRDGYYVYYEKNPQMREFMMQGKDEGEHQPEIDPQKAVVTSYREITSKNSRRGGKVFQTMVYASCLALLVAVTAMGVNMMSSAGKIERLEEAVSFLEAEPAEVEAESAETETKPAAQAHQATPQQLSPQIQIESEIQCQMQHRTHRQILYRMPNLMANQKLRLTPNRRSNQMPEPKTSLRIHWMKQRVSPRVAPGTSLKQKQRRRRRLNRRKHRHLPSRIITLLNRERVCSESARNCMGEIIPDNYVS